MDLSLSQWSRDSFLDYVRIYLIDGGMIECKDIPEREAVLDLVSASGLTIGFSRKEFSDLPLLGIYYSDGLNEVHIGLVDSSRLIFLGRIMTFVQLHEEFTLSPRTDVDIQTRFDDMVGE